MCNAGLFCTQMSLKHIKINSAKSIKCLHSGFVPFTALMVELIVMRTVARTCTHLIGHVVILHLHRNTVYGVHSKGRFIHRDV